MRPLETQGLLIGDKEWCSQIHKRLVTRDPTAPAELAEACLRPLYSWLRRTNSRIQDDAALWDAVEDAIMNYAEKPESYDEQIALFGYLKMSARGDLRNALEKQRRRHKHEILEDDVEQGLSGGNVLTGKSFLPSRASDGATLEMINECEDIQGLKARVRKEIPDPVDYRVLELMLEGERKTAAFANAMKVQNLGEAEQRKLVKRKKDQLKKRLERLGMKLSTEWCVQ